MSEKGQYWRIACRVQLSDSDVETLRQTREQVERDDEECLVGFIVVDRILLVLLESDEGGFDDLNASFEHWLSVVGESRSDGDNDRRQTLIEKVKGESAGNFERRELETYLE